MWRISIVQSPDTLHQFAVVLNRSIFQDYIGGQNYSKGNIDLWINTYPFYWNIWVGSPCLLEVLYRSSFSSLRS